MSIPNNMRAFSIELAQQGHPICTQNKQIAKFIAYVPDVIAHHQLLVQIGDEIVRYDNKGSNPYVNMDHWDLFLAPLAYCEGKPVFAGDVLISKLDGFQYPAEIGHEHFDHCKWPSKAPVVETRMTEKELRTVYDKHCGNPVYSMTKDIANKAIKRAILDGDVIASQDAIPTVCVLSLMCDAYNKHYSSAVSFRCVAEDVLNNYLEKLK